MGFRVTKEQKEFRQEVLDFVSLNLNDSRYYEEFSMDMWRKVSDFGLLGITIDEEYGGLAENYQTAAIIFEALGYGCKNNGFVFAINNHIWVSQNLIYLYATKLLKDKYLHGMVAGKQIGSIAITEVESGSDVMSMTTTAKEETDCYLLNGTKMFISNGPIADIFIVFAVTQIEPVVKLSAFVVERNFAGVSTGKDIEKMGLNACPTSELILDNIRIPKENLLGNFNGGSSIMMDALEWERCFEFAPYIGVMQRVMEECIKYANSRKQFGKNIGDNQAVSHKIAEMTTAIEMAKLMLYQIAWLKDHKKSAYFQASIFKLFVSENYIKTCRDALRIFGAYGYCKEYDLERELRDAIASSIHSGTNEMQKNTIYSMVNAKCF